MAAVKYHISKESGRPNICRAEIQDCPVGGAHFGDKKEAKEYAEKTLKNEYGETSSLKKTSTKKKKKNTTVKHPVNYDQIIQTQQLFNDLAMSNNKKMVDEYAYEALVASPMDEAQAADFIDMKGDVYNFSNDDMRIISELSQFKTKGRISQIDYMDDVLIEKDGQSYVASFAVDTWGWGDKNEFLSIRPVQKIEKDQIATNIEPVDEIDDSEISQLAEKVLIKNHNKKNSYDIYKDFDFKDDENIVYHEIYSEGDTTYTDAIPEVESDIYLYENDEKQNARVMEKGVLIFDKKLNKGFIKKYMTASEDYFGDDNVTIKNGKITGNDLYFVKGIGTKKATGWTEVRNNG